MHVVGTGVGDRASKLLLEPQVLLANATDETEVEETDPTIIGRS